MRLTDEGRERDLIGPEPGDYAPFHKVERCRIIRDLRERIAQQCPGWEIDIAPTHRPVVAALRVRLERVIDDQLHTLCRVYSDEQMMHAPGAHILRQFEAEQIALTVAQLPAA